MATQTEAYDIAVIGGGNAALCAAMTAAEVGARVLMLETAPKPYRGGNSRHTRNFRCMHHGPLGPLVDAYSEDDYLSDLLKVTDGKTDEHLARLAIRTSEECLPWMEEQGGSLSTVFVRNTLACADKRVFYGRRQVFGECVLQDSSGSGRRCAV